MWSLRPFSSSPSRRLTLLSDDFVIESPAASSLGAHDCFALSTHSAVQLMATIASSCKRIAQHECDVMHSLPLSDRGCGGVGRWGGEGCHRCCHNHVLPMMTAHSSVMGRTDRTSPSLKPTAQLTPPIPPLARSVDVMMTSILSPIISSTKRDPRIISFTHAEVGPRVLFDLDLAFAKTFYAV